MRKVLTTPLAALSLLLALSSCTAPAPEPTPFATDAPALQASLELNRGLAGIRHPIEEAYVAEAGQTPGDTAALAALYDKYGELWQEETAKYETLIQEELTDAPEALAAFRSTMETWRGGIEGEVEAFSAIEIHLHGAGTISGPNVARYSMELYRAQALKLIALYDELMVGRGWSWRGQAW